MTKIKNNYSLLYIEDQQLSICRCNEQVTIYTQRLTFIWVVANLLVINLADTYYLHYFSLCIIPNIKRCKAKTVDKQNNWYKLNFIMLHPDKGPRKATKKIVLMLKTMDHDLNINFSAHT